MKRALVLGGTNKESLGRKLALALLADGISPILVGRSAMKVSHDLELEGAEFIPADLVDLNVGEQVLGALGDCANVDLVIVAGGIFDSGPLVQCSPVKIDQLWRTNVMGPELVVRSFLAEKRGAYQLVTVASTSATKPRADEPIYAATQAARRHFALSFHGQMLGLDSGSKSLVICPGGMCTNMYQGTTMSTERFMDPSVVAMHIMAVAHQQQAGSCAELRIERNPDGTANVLPIVNHSV